MTTLDCTSCGACCVNPDENRAENYIWYLAVEDTELLRRPDLKKRLVVLDPEGVPHMRLESNGRCVALRGKLGERAHCSIYPLRPRGCRLLRPGDPRCQQARVERGLEPKR